MKSNNVAGNVVGEREAAAGEIRLDNRLARIDSLAPPLAGPGDVI